MTQEEIAARVERFVRLQFSVASTDLGFSRRGRLFELGYIDSVGVVELLAFLGEQFGVDITDGELLSDEFQTINGIANIVYALRTRANPSAAPS